MPRRNFTHAALAAAVMGAAAFAVAARAADAPAQPKEMCYGVAKAAENDCGNSSHSCAGMSKVDYSGQDFAEVPVGTCVKMDGSLAAYTGTNPKKKA